MEMNKPEPSTITPPSSLAAFHHMALKFLCLGQYISGLAGEKEKIICIIKPKIIVASIRATVTEEMSLSTVTAIHHQDVIPNSQGRDSPPPSTQPALDELSRIETQTDLVLTDTEGKKLAFTIPRSQLNSFLGVALYYCPKDTPVHEISPQAAPLVESLVGLKRTKSMMSALVSLVQHAGQDREKQLEAIKHGDTTPTVASVVASSEVPRANDDAHELLHNNKTAPASSSTDEQRAIRIAESKLRGDTIDATPLALNRLALHADSTYTPMGHRALPGDNELSNWKHAVPPVKPLDTHTPIFSPASTLARPSFGEGGTIVLPSLSVQRQRLIRKEESETITGMMEELKKMQFEIEKLKNERQTDRNLKPHAMADMQRSTVEQEAGVISSSQPYARDSDDDEEEEPDVPDLPKQRRAAALMLSSPGGDDAARSARVADNVRTSLLPLLTASTQQAALQALQELRDTQRTLLDMGKKYVNPAIQRQLTAMEEPLRTLHRLLNPRGGRNAIATLAPAGSIGDDMSPEFVPMWALVDFGEVNYDCVPLCLKQYHRLVVRKVDEEGASYVMIATRQQFALDEGYTMIPFASVLDVAFGAQPRSVRAQRITVDGTITSSDERMENEACLSVRTRLQHILFQFEDAGECKAWMSVLTNVVVENTGKLPQGRFVDQAVVLPSSGPVLSTQHSSSSVGSLHDDDVEVSPTDSPIPADDL